MKNILFSVILFAPASVFCQYYFTDLHDARTISQKMDNLVKQKVKTITATGYDARGSKTTDFNEWQEVNADKKTLRISTRNGQEVNRQVYYFDSQYRLISITDSSRDIKSTTVYSYDNQGNLVSVKTTIRDSLQDFSETVDNQYSYNANGNPEKLLRILNATDSLEYRFKVEDNNVTDEQLFRRGTGLDPIYYYYDDQHRLTDIVRYNNKAKKLLPTQMFEYDAAGRVIQKMTVISTNQADYLIWRYIYNDKGLKTKEALFNKQKELTGRIEYAYTFE